MTYYYIEIEHGREKGRRFQISPGAVPVGRKTGNAITLAGEGHVSSFHAVIYNSPQRMLLQDMQSTNGTYVNGERVQEKELSPGDLISFGEEGPRARVVASDVELSTDYIPGENSSTHQPVDDSTNRVTTVASSKTEQSDLSPQKDKTKHEHTKKVDRSSANGFPHDGATMTGVMEKKFLDKKIDASDMANLMKDGRRVEKILDRGNIGATQAGMLLSAYSAGKQIRKQSLTLIVIISVVSLAAISFFAIKSFQYRALVNRGLSLEEQMDKYEKQIAEYNDNPDRHQEELQLLIARLDRTREEFNGVKVEIKEEDVERFFVDSVEGLIDNIMIRFGETNYHIPPQMVERVRHHLDVYSGRLKPAISRYIARKEKYESMILKILRENNLPPELMYVSMLESGFNPRALSHAGARGLWQFMPRTARNYGLRVDDSVDERLDPIKATRAAAEYFKDLIAIFGGRRSVMLAMAAYNAGEGRVMGALRKIDNPLQDRDFWYIYRMGYLAEETNEYIPRILALMIIDENLEGWGFGDQKPPEEDLEQERDFIEVDVAGVRE